MYVNTKMISAETVPGITGRGMNRTMEEGSSSMIYLINCKKLCKCYNVLTPSPSIKKGKKTAKA
jgi:hypothetical protein